MSFIDILNGKKQATAAAIAVQIVALEDQIDSYRDQKEKAWAEARAFRQRKIAGDKVSDADIREIDRKVDDAKLNLEAAEESIELLRKKLREAVVAERSIREGEIEEKKAGFREKKATLLEEIIAVAGKLRALQISLFGGEIQPDGLVVHFEAPEHRSKFKAASEKAQATLTDPEVFNDEKLLLRESQRLANLVINDEAERILSEVRATAANSE